MSFFGFGPAGHNTAAPGFSQIQDPFAGLSSSVQNADGINFDDTYDGLGDQLDETGDAFNDDTFGGDSGPVGKDFDFFGATAKVSDAMEEENVRFNRTQPAKAPAPGPASAPVAIQAMPAPYMQEHKPARTGYEQYREPEHAPALSVDRSIWGMAPDPTPIAEPAFFQAAPQAPAPAAQPASRKVLSLEEVEAQMLANASRGTMGASQTPQPAQAGTPQPYPSMPAQGPYAMQAIQAQAQAQAQQAQAHAQAQAQAHHAQAQAQAEAHAQTYYAQQAHAQTQSFPGQGHGPIKILERPHSRHTQPSPATPQGPAQHAPAHHQMRPTQILQNPNRMSGDASRMTVPGHVKHRPQGSMGRVVSGQHGHSAGPHGPYGHMSHGPIPGAQLPPMSEQEMGAYMEQEARRAKRNHKIFLLSKDNGVMTPQDKNFVTRIQLQQLVAATGSPAEPGQDAAQSEDFYYQVYTSIRSTQRQNPNQPLGNFAQTYLFQTGNRQGRRQGRPAENHVQRMELQVQRAVEAAKNKPKNPQLVIAGSLGKISFSNAKTPKPLLNIKRPEPSVDAQRPTSSRRHDQGPADKKTTLRSIESIYSTLMKLEDHVRLLPPLPASGVPDDEFRARHAEWLAVTESLNDKLWADLKVMEPIGATTVHPFIALISHAKGKKAIPRVFRHTSLEQKTTILTMIIYHLDQLDVTRGAHIFDGEIHLDAAMRENVELFSSTVMPSLFGHINETPLAIVDGTLCLISRLNVDLIAKSRIGTSMLTMILSRAELIKQLGEADPGMWQKWEQSFSDFFNMLEPSLPNLFPGSVNSGEDVYVWQFLAAIGVGATPDQQQRLVLAVKDRVLDTVSHAKSLPAAMSGQRLANVNLFMHSIGLDVELLQ